MAKKKRRRYTKLRIDETSAVDQPAQEPAVAVALFKRAESAADLPAEIRAALAAQVEKGYVPDEPALTNSVDGHSHLLDVSTIAGQTSWEISSSSDSGHSHPYIIDGGNVIIGEADGHTHEVEVIASKNAGNGNSNNGDPMPDQTPTPDAKSVERIDELEKALAFQSSLGAMTDAQKAHRATISDSAEADAFVMLAPEKREAAVEAAKSADAVVYVSKADGTEYRASDDPRLVALAKRDDEREIELAKAKDARETEVYKARAKAELAHLPGDEAVQVALLKAVDTIDDEELRGKVLEAVKANDAKVAQTGERVGASGADASGGDAEKQLEQLAKVYATEHKVSFIKAYNAVTKDGGKGQALFAETLSQPTAIVG